MGTILNAHVAGAESVTLGLAGGEGAFQTIPAHLRGQMAQGIRAAFLFGLAAVAVGIPLSLMVPDVSPVRPGAEARSPAAASTGPME
jgi:hypothetical protein